MHILRNNSSICWDDDKRVSFLIFFEGVVEVNEKWCHLPISTLGLSLSARLSPVTHSLIRGCLSLILLGVGEQWLKSNPVELKLGKLCGCGGQQPRTCQNAGPRCTGRAALLFEELRFPDNFWRRPPKKFKNLPIDDDGCRHGRTNQSENYGYESEA
jgi:hypothetical protein